MGENLLKFRNDTFVIDGCEFSGITDFTADMMAGNEYIEGCSRMKFNEYARTFTATCKINIFTWYKVIGWWGWIEQNCPNKRLIWLMNHGKSIRVRRKNLRRAFREIAKILEQKGE